MSEIAHVFNLGDQVTVKADATHRNGDPLPQAGKRGTVAGSNTPGWYMVDVPGFPVVNILGDMLEVLDRTPSADVTDVVAKGEAPLAPVPATAAPLNLGYGFDVLERALIVASLTNPRTYFDPIALTELAESIKALGLAQPILVRRLPASRLAETWTDRRKGDPAPTHEVVAGERRWRACGMAAVRSVPVLIRELTDEQVLDLQLAENLQRKDLHPLEEAHGYRKILDLPQHAALPMAERVAHLCERIKKSPRYIYQTLQLLQLCDFSQKVFLDSAIKLEKTTALQIATIGNEAGQIEATRRIAGLGTKGMEVVNDPMSQRAASEYVRNTFRLVLSKAPFPVKVEYAGQAACTTCEKMSANAAELFEEGHKAPDTCMDPACYGKKNGAYQLQLAEAAKAQGQRVLTGKDARKHTSKHEPDDLTYDSEYEALDDRRFGLIEPHNGKTIAQILGKDAPAPVLIERTDGTGFIKALPRKDVDKLLKERGLLRASTSGVSDSQREAERKAKAEKETRWAIAEQLLAAVDEYPEPDQTLLSALQVNMAMRIYNRLDNESSKRCRKLLGWDIERGFNHHQRAGLLKHFRSLDSRQFNRFVVAACIAGELHYAPNWRPDTDDMDEIAGLLKVDPKAIRSNLQAAKKAEEKAKADKKKAPATKADKKKAPATKAAVADDNKAASMLTSVVTDAVLLSKLAKSKIQTRDDLADLSVDELTEITGQTADDAKALIMKAREPWFADAAPASAEKPTKPAKVKRSAATKKAAEAQLGLPLPSEAAGKTLSPQNAWPFPLGKETPAEARERAAAAKSSEGATA